MNLDIQPNHVTVLINAASISQAIQQLTRAKVALQTMVVPAAIGEEELQALLADLAGRFAVGQAAVESTAPAEAQEPAPEPDIAAAPAAEDESPTAPPAATTANDEPPAASRLSDTAQEPAPAATQETAPPADELPPVANLQAELNKAGQKLFDEEWAQALPWLVKRYTSKFTADNVRDRLSKLTAAEVADLIIRLVENAAALQTAWAEQKATGQPKPRQIAKRSTKRTAAQQATHERMAHPANVVMATG